MTTVLKTLIAGVLAASMLASAGEAHEQVFGSLRIAHPYVITSMPDEASTLGYAMEITNKGADEERLIGASLDAAGSGVLRSSVIEQGHRKFAPIEGGIKIAPNTGVELGPGRAHIYFPGLKGGLKEGEMVKGTLVFEKAGALEVEFMIEPASAAEPDIPPSAKSDPHEKTPQEDHGTHHHTGH